MIRSFFLLDESFCLSCYHPSRSYQIIQELVYAETKSNYNLHAAQDFRYNLFSLILFVLERESQCIEHHVPLGHYSYRASAQFGLI